MQALIVLVKRWTDEARGETYSVPLLMTCFYSIPLSSTVTLLRPRRYETTHRIGLFFRQGQYSLSTTY